MIAALLLALGAAPLEARFLVSVAGVPQATLSVSSAEGTYRYRSVHWLEEGEAVLERTWALADGGVEGLEPEVLALLQPPAPGCRPVLEERRGVPEVLCAGPREGPVVKGTLDGVGFVARYGAGGLVAVEVGPVRFERVAGAVPRPAEALPSPFREGFAVAGAGRRVALDPPLAGARVVAVEPGPASAPRERCLAVARRAVAEEPSLQLVLGLVVEGGRAFPHAWVRRGGRDVDVTLGPGDGEVMRGRAYLELPRGQEGRVYLEVLEGRRRVLRQ